MLLVVLLLQSAQDLKLGRVERNRDAVVDGRGATLDVKPLESAWSAEREQMSRGRPELPAVQAQRWSSG